MKKNKHLILGIALLISFFAQTAFGQNVSDIKLDNKQSILNGRAFLLFPKDAKNEARSTDLMSAERNINQETRIVLNIENMKLVFFAQELYMFGDSNLYAAVSKEEGTLDFQRKILTNQDQLFSILSTPIVFDSTKRAILVNSLLVKTQDNSIFRIDAYINLGAYKLKSDFVKLTEHVFQTLSKGKRLNNISAREEIIPILGTKKSFKFSIPENYCITIDESYDFQVIKFHKYKNYSDTNWVSLTIYTGNHPSYFYPEYKFDQSTAKKVDGNFLNKNVDWLSFYDPVNQIYLKEQKIPSDNIRIRLIAHIAMLGNQENSIAELTKIVESITLK